VFHEIVELVRALAWPLVVLFFGWRFEPEIRSLLLEMPGALRRMKSAHGLGIEVELDKIGSEINIASDQAQALQPQPIEPPKPKMIDGGR